MLNNNYRIRIIIVLTLCMFVSLSFVACKKKELDKRKIASLEEKEGKKMAIKITSLAFADGEMIPRKYTCDGEGISPPLEWESVPENAKSIVLISDDPDAPMGTWVHWVVYDMPSAIKELPENISTEKPLLDDIERLNLFGKQGVHSGGRIGYGPPCPPSGTHRYFFKIYALDTMLNLKPGASKKKVLKAMKGHIIADGQLMGRYKR